MGPFTHFLEPDHELKDLYYVNTTLMVFITNFNNNRNRVISIPFSSDKPTQKIYLKDIEWKLHDIQDTQKVSESEIEDEKAIMTQQLGYIISRIIIPGRFKREEIVDAMKAIGIKTTISQDISKILTQRLDVSKAEKLLEKIKVIHKNNVQILAFESINYPKPLFGIVRDQGDIYFQI